MAELVYKIYRILIDFTGKTEENIFRIQFCEQPAEKRLLTLEKKVWVKHPLK